MSRPTVLALVTEAFGGRGGIGQYNRDFLTALGAMDARVIALPRRSQDSFEECPNVKQRRATSNRAIYSLQAFWSLLRERPDVIFCGHLYMAPLAWFLARSVGAKLIIQAHGIEAWNRPSHLTRLVVESADRIFCVSRYTRAKLLGWASIAPERVSVLPNTVQECFTPESGDAVRKEWGLEGRRVVLTVGRMDSRERYKGQDRIISLLPELVGSGIDVVFVIVGEGDDRDRLATLAQTGGVADRVKFVGALSQDLLIAAYRMADVFVLASLGEGFGIVFLEAMACGTPAIGLDAAGVSDALADGELGVAVPECDLANAIRKVLVATSAAPQERSRSVKDRFGVAAFRKRTHSAIGSLMCCTN
jgi:phosphatidylinositol alpha-1,6-mannosyltransferase